MHTKRAFHAMIAHNERMMKRLPLSRQSTKVVTRLGMGDGGFADREFDCVAMLRDFVDDWFVRQYHGLFWDAADVRDTVCGQVLAYICDNPEEMKAQQIAKVKYIGEQHCDLIVWRQALSLVQMWNSLKLALMEGVVMDPSAQREVQKVFLDKKPFLPDGVIDIRGVIVNHFSPRRKEGEDEIDEDRHLILLLHLFSVLSWADSVGDGVFRMPGVHNFVKNTRDTQRHLGHGDTNQSLVQAKAVALANATDLPTTEQDKRTNTLQSNIQGPANPPQLTSEDHGIHRAMEGMKSFIIELERGRRECDLPSTKSQHWSSANASQQTQQDPVTQRQLQNDPSNENVGQQQMGSIASASEVKNREGSSPMPTQQCDVESTYVSQISGHNPPSQRQSDQNPSNQVLVQRSFIARESEERALVPTKQRDFAITNKIPNGEQSALNLVEVHEMPPMEIIVVWNPNAKVPWAKELLGALKGRGMKTSNLETRKMIKIWPSHTAEEVRDQIRAKFKMEEVLGAQIRTLVTISNCMDALLEDWNDVQKELWREEIQSRGFRMTLRKMHDKEDIWEL